ncbi:hypothetical protein [Microbacterium sp. NPDC086615]|uniref:hypothetical protein n=1 Tax=Microbacterium sp. NPDC086615 TaxID=3154865 RepID=UPI003442B219
MPDGHLSLAPILGSATPKTRLRIRAVASVVLLAFAVLTVPLALVAAWARLQLVDEDAFAATLTPLAADPRVQSLVIDEATSAITASLDASVPDAAAPPAAARALELLGRPTAAAARSLTERAVTEVVHSDRFSSVWAAVVHTSHRALVFGATSDGGGIIVLTPDDLGVQVGGVVSAITDELSLQGSPVAALIPRVDHVVIVGDGAPLRMLRAGYALATAAGVLLPALAVVLLAGGALVEQRRGRAIIGTGLAIVVGSGVLLIGAAAAPTVVARTAAAGGLDPAGVAAIVRQLLTSLVGSSGVVFGAGALLLAVGVIVARRTGRTAAHPKPTPGDLAATTDGRIRPLP